MKKPAIPLTDPRFVYVPSTHSDIRKTFAKVREQMQAERHGTCRTHHEKGPSVS